VTTPAQDAPLVFPSVAFRPMRLLIVCVALTGVALLAAGFVGHIFFGVFFGLGLILDWADAKVSDAFTPGTLMMAGLFCLALHLAGVGASTNWRGRVRR